MTSRVPYWMIALVLLAASSASAHRVNLLVLSAGDTVRGHVYYADGSPVAGVRVDVQGADGASIDSVTTDAEGRFAYVPQVQSDLVFVVKTDDGHRAESAYTSARPSPPASAAAGPAAPELVDSARIEQIVQQELTPLREQLDAYQHEIRVRDILGGMGYIIGVLGLVAWIKARRPGRAP